MNQVGGYENHGEERKKEIDIPEIQHHLVKAHENKCMFYVLEGKVNTLFHWISISHP